MLLFDEAPIGWLAASLRHLNSPFLMTSTQVDELETHKRFWKQVVVRRVLRPAVNLESPEAEGDEGMQNVLTFRRPS